MRVFNSLLVANRYGHYTATSRNTQITSTDALISTTCLLLESTTMNIYGAPFILQAPTHQEHNNTNEKHDSLFVVSDVPVTST
jgi:hypothetical protein